MQPGETRPRLTGSDTSVASSSYNCSPRQHELTASPAPAGGDAANGMPLNKEESTPARRPSFLQRLARALRASKSASAGSYAPPDAKLLRLRDRLSKPFDERPYKQFHNGRAIAHGDGAGRHATRPAPSKPAWAGDEEAQSFQSGRSPGADDSDYSDDEFPIATASSATGMLRMACRVITPLVLIGCVFYIASSEAVWTSNVRMAISQAWVSFQSLLPRELPANLPQDWSSYAAGGSEQLAYSRYEDDWN